MAGHTAGPVAQKPLGVGAGVRAQLQGRVCSGYRVFLYEVGVRLGEPLEVGWRDTGTLVRATGQGLSHSVSGSPSHPRAILGSRAAQSPCSVSAALVPAESGHRHASASPFRALKRMRCGVSRVLSVLRWPRLCPGTPRCRAPTGLRVACPVSPMTLGPSRVWGQPTGLCWGAQSRPMFRPRSRRPAGSGGCREAPVLLKALEQPPQGLQSGGSEQRQPEAAAPLHRRAHPKRGAAAPP